MCDLSIQEVVVYVLNNLVPQIPNAKKHESSTSHLCNLTARGTGHQMVPLYISFAYSLFVACLSNSAAIQQDNRLSLLLTDMPTIYFATLCFGCGSNRTFS